MRIIDRIIEKQNLRQRVLSVEIIPPRNGERLEVIMRKIEELQDASPDFISVTRGAGGSLRGGTVPIAYIIKQKTGMETMAHLTCIDTPVEELENSLMDHRYLGIENILALRGDPPRDASEDYAHYRGFHYHKYALELVSQIRLMNEGKYLTREMDKAGSCESNQDAYREGEKTNFCIAAAGHPEGHPQCPDKEKTLLHLKAKVEAGADFIITQMVFDVDIYTHFVSRCRQLGITVPIIPGVRPLLGAKRLDHIENFFSVTIPETIKTQLMKLKGKKAKEKGLELTASLCEKLLEAGAPGIHLYLMNDVSTGKELIRHLRAADS